MMQKWMACLLCLFLFQTLQSQIPNNLRTESGEKFLIPLDDIVEKRIIAERRILPFDPIREADIFWEKRIWRVIDVREKMNLPFAYPEQPFFSILLDAAINGKMTVYSAENDKFSYPLEPSEVASKSEYIDTVLIINPTTLVESIKIVRNQINPEDIKQFRIKEVWFFDEETSTLKVRILGIAPIKDEYDENGNFKYSLPLFWVYYPDCRTVLARHTVFNPKNDASPMTWEDLFEMRNFSSYITKQSNEYNRKIEGYALGVDQLLEAEKIRMEIFNFEHDLWSY